MTKPVESTSGGSPPHSSHMDSLGILTKPVESTSGTPTHLSHTLAHTAF